MEALCGCRSPKACGSFSGALAPSCGAEAEVVGNEIVRYVLPGDMCPYVGGYDLWEVVCFSKARLRKPHCISSRKKQTKTTQSSFLYPQDSLT